MTDTLRSIEWLALNLERVKAAKHCPMLSLDSKVMWCSCGWRSKESPTEWAAHIRSLPDLAADEAIEAQAKEKP